MGKTSQLSPWLVIEFTEAPGPGPAAVGDCQPQSLLTREPSRELRKGALGPGGRLKAALESVFGGSCRLYLVELSSVGMFLFSMCFFSHGGLGLFLFFCFVCWLSRCPVLFGLGFRRLVLGQRRGGWRL